MKAAAIIPARYASTRLPGKALLEIAGRPMIEHVYMRALEARGLDEVWVATDDERIRDAVLAFGGRVRLTRPDHPSGTDRIAEVAAGVDAEIVVNVQGDEPMLDPAVIEAVLEPLREDPALPMSTCAVEIRDPHLLHDPAAVKVVFGRDGHALYFSRLPIPYFRTGSGPYYKHLGIYGYRRTFLLHYPTLPQTPLERAESLEQLRALEHGYRIRVVLTDREAIGVDTPDDLERVRALMERRD